MVLVATSVYRRFFVLVGKNLTFRSMHIYIRIYIYVSTYIYIYMYFYIYIYWSFVAKVRDVTMQHVELSDVRVEFWMIDESINIYIYVCIYTYLHIACSFLFAFTVSRPLKKETGVSKKYFVCWLTYYWLKSAKHCSTSVLIVNNPVCCIFNMCSIMDVLHQ